MDVNILLSNSIKEMELIEEGEVFLVKDLFKGYICNRIPRKNRLLLVMLSLNHINKLDIGIKAIEKISSGQQRCKKYAIK